MFHHLLLKFSLFFIAGVAFTVAIAYMFVPNEAQKLVKTGEGSALVLSTTTEAQDEAKSMIQGVLGDVVEHISKSPALAPFFETKQSVETAVFEVQSLPDAQRKAVCQEICTTK